MNQNREAWHWHVLGQTVRGASHVRAGLVNQDAISYVQGKDQDRLPVLLSVADGHGSPRYCRSDVGAALAVKVALTELRDASINGYDINNLSAIKQVLEDQLPRRIVRTWREQIERHYREHNFTAEDEAYVTEKAGKQAWQRLLSEHPVPYTAYGTTLLIAWVMPEFVAYLQLGDGDILVVEESEVDDQLGVLPSYSASKPMASDSRLLGNETTSLCSPKAWADFRTSFQVMYKPPALIMLSTDGYANSFASQDGFHSVATDLLNLLKAEGVAVVQQKLADWLNEASAKGSGDDVTLGLIYRGEQSLLPTSQSNHPYVEQQPAASTPLPHSDSFITSRHSAPQNEEQP